MSKCTVISNLFLVEEKPQVITPGLVTDITMGVLSSSGYNVRTMNVTDYKGYVNHFQESMIETAVTQRAICLVNDLEKIPSFLDNDLRLGDRYTIDGTTYSFVNGSMVAQDFRFQTRVRRNAEGKIVYDPTTVYMPDLISSDITSRAPTTVTIGKSVSECTRTLFVF